MLKTNQQLRRRRRRQEDTIVSLLQSYHRGVLEANTQQEESSSASLDEEESIFYTPTPPCNITKSIAEISNDNVDDCPDLPDYYGPCDTTETSLLMSNAYGQITLGFDYELYYNSNDIVDAPPIDYIQGIILEHLSFVWEIGCENGRRRRRRLRHRTLQANHADTTFNTKMIALSLNPQDRILQEVSCKAPVVASVAESSNCHLVAGSLTLYTTSTNHNDDKQNLPLTSSVLREIRSAMLEDVYVAGNIQKVIFMGQRTIDIVPPPPTTPPNDDGLDNLQLPPTIQNNNGASILAISLWVLLILCFCGLVLVLVLVPRSVSTCSVKQEDTRDDNSDVADASTSEEDGDGNEELYHDNIIYEPRQDDGSFPSLRNGIIDGSFPSLGNGIILQTTRKQEQPDSLPSTPQEARPIDTAEALPASPEPNAPMLQPASDEKEQQDEEEESFLSNTYALVRSLSSMGAADAYTKPEDKTNDNDCFSAASSSSQSGGLHLVDEDDNDIYESLRRVTDFIHKSHNDDDDYEHDSDSTSSGITQNA